MRPLAALVVFLAACTQPAPIQDGGETVQLELKEVPRAGGAATVRDALQLPGVANVDVTPGSRVFTVVYDPARVTTEQMLAALRGAREEATIAPAVGQQDVEYVQALEGTQRHRPPVLRAAGRIAPEDEPGTPLVIHGRVVGEDGRTPVAGAVVFAYHTDRDGRYDRPGAPAHSWRLRGWVQADADGRFELSSIRPGAYPSRAEPAHVHVAVFAGKVRYHAGAVLFADDPLVTPAHRERSDRVGDFGEVRPVRRVGSTEHVDFCIRLVAKGRF